MRIRRIRKLIDEVNFQAVFNVSAIGTHEIGWSLTEIVITFGLTPTEAPVASGVGRKPSAGVEVSFEEFCWAVILDQSLEIIQTRCVCVKI